MKIPQLQQRTRAPSLQTNPIEVPAATPAAFGAALGQGLASIGVGLSSIQEEEEKVKKFDALRRLSDHEVEVALKVDEAKKAAPPNGLGYRKSVEELIAKSEEQFLSSVPENLRPEFRVRYSKLRDSQILAAQQTETKLQSDFFVSGINAEQTKALTTVEAAPEQYEQIKSRMFETIDASGLSEAEKFDLKQKAEKNLASVKMRIEIERNRVAKHNIDPNDSIPVLVDRIVQAESSGNPNLKATTSSALGLGQFPEATWMELMTKYAPEETLGKSRQEILALRTNPELSKFMIENYARQNAGTLRRAGFPTTPQNLYLSHFLGPSGAVRLLRLDDDTPVESAVSSAAYDANRSVFTKNPTVGDLKKWAAGKMGIVKAIDPTISATRGEDGYWTLPGVEYELTGKTRSLPVSREYVERTYSAIKSIDPSLGFVITSAGQEADGPNRTGSHRHDVDASGTARTSDIVLTKNGKKVSYKEAPELYAKAAEELAAAGFTGIGHYGWGMHVGGGSKAVWGPSTTSSDVDPAFAAAVRRGWARNADSPLDAIDTDPTYALVPYETRVALRKDAEKKAQDLVTDQLKIEKLELEKKQNELYLGLFDGSKGQIDIDRAKEDGVLNDYDSLRKVTKILESRDKERSAAEQFVRIQADPSAVIDPTDSNTKKALNAGIGKSGLNAISQMDGDYFNSTVVPVARRWGMLPDAVVGTLTGMIQSRDPNRVKFGLESLAALEQAAPAAYRAQVNEDISRTVDRWGKLKGVSDTGKLIEDIIGTDSAEVRKSREALEKEGESYLRTIESKQPIAKKLVSEFIDSYDSFFTTAPKPPSLSTTMMALEREYSAEFIRAYGEVGSPDKAAELATMRLKKTWGVSEIGGTKQIMRYPPESMNLPKLDGKIDWVREQLEKDFGVKEGELVELYPVPSMAERIAKQQPPAYYAVRFWPDGRVEPLKGPNGENAIEFKLDPETKKKDEEMFSVRSRIAEIDQQLNSEEMNDDVHIATPELRKEIAKERLRLKLERRELEQRLPKGGPKEPVSILDSFLAPIPF